MDHAFIVINSIFNFGGIVIIALPILACFGNILHHDIHYVRLRLRSTVPKNFFALLLNNHQILLLQHRPCLHKNTNIVKNVTVLPFLHHLPQFLQISSSRFNTPDTLHGHHLAQKVTKPTRTIPLHFPPVGILLAKRGTIVRQTLMNDGQIQQLPPGIVMRRADGVEERRGERRRVSTVEAQPIRQSLDRFGGRRGREGGQSSV
mmetsp:Transcript_8995/g.11045  ORF Transcript_8995/g.11045 Transcript_8995/m.11045 type:complete len:204 (+) Transcript_8995:728-1339(+)